MKTKAAVLNMGSLLAAMLLVLLVAAPVWAAAPLITNQTLTVAENSPNGTTTNPIKISAGDPEGQAITYSVLSGDGMSVFAVNSTTGEVTVTDGSQLDHETKPSFTLVVRVQDTDAQTNQATITINVTDVSDEPVFIDDQEFDIPMNSPNGTTVGVLEIDDEDEDDSYIFTIEDGNGSGAGAFAIDNTGKITVKDSAQLNGVKTFVLEVKVEDEGGSDDTADITINVTNTPPQETGSGIPDVIVNEGAPPRDITLRNYFEDAEDTDANLVFTIQGNTKPDLFSPPPSINNTNDVLTLSFATGVGGTASITIRATDTAGAFEEDIFQVDMNEAPVPTGYPNITVNEDAPNSQVNLYNGFTDAEQPSSTLIYELVTISNPGLFSSAEISLPNLVLDYAPDTNGQTSITIRATDNDDLSAETTFTVKVNEGNDAPTTTGIANVTVSEDAPNTVINLFSAFDDKEDEDDELTYEIKGNTNSGLFESVTINGQSGTLTLDYKVDTSGEANLTVRATDQGGEFVETGFKVTVSSVNDKPVVSDFGKSTNEDVSFQFSLNDFASHFDDPDGSDLADVRIQSLPDDGTLKLGNANVTLNQVIPAAQLGNLTFVPLPNWDQGSTSFDWNGSDGTDYAAEAAEVTVSVSPLNDAPIADDFEKVANEGVAVHFAEIDFVNAFSDVDGDALEKIRIENLPPNGTLKLGNNNVTAKQQINDENLHQLQFVPDAFWSGETTFNWSGSDGSLYSSPAKVTITINPQNNAPALDLNGGDSGTGFDAVFVTGGAPVAITGQDLTISDADSPTMQGATVIIVNRKNGAKEILSANAQGTNIQVDFNEGIGTLFLSGSDTIANYEKVLKTVKYQIAPDVTNPDSTQRDISFRVNDGELNSNDTFAEVDIIHPEITISVDPPFQTVPKGTTVVFTVSIENTGDVDLENIVVTSLTVPDCNRGPIDELDAGESLPAYACVVSNVTARIDNEVEVMAQDKEMGSQVTDSDESIVRVLQDVSINIAPDPLVGNTVIKGQNAAFNVLVVNPSQSKLTNVVVKAFIDYDVGTTIDTPSEEVPAPACDFVVGELKAGQQKTYSCAIANVQASFSIEVKVTAKTEVATDTADFDIAEIGVLDLTLEVFSDPFEIPAGQPTPVEFNLTLANVSNVTLELSGLESDLHGDLLDAANSGISANTCPALDESIPEGEVRSCSYEVTLMVQPPALTNVITATVTDDDDQELSISDEAIVSVNDFSPLEVVLAANPASLVAPGGEVNLSVQVTNNTSAELTLDAMSDSVVGNLHNKGTCELPQVIPANGSYSCTYPATISGKSPGDVVTHAVTAMADAEQASDSVAIPITSASQVSLMLPAVSSGAMAGEPNNGICRALPIMTNNTYFYLADDANDWYRFTLESPANVKIKLSNFLATEGQLIVFTGNCSSPGNPIGHNGEVSEDGQPIPVREIDLGQRPPGTYYIWVLTAKGVNSASPYTLRVDAIAP